jgi:predicted RNA-binding Zn ribbon-like protein
MKKRRKRPTSKEPEAVRRDGALCAAFVNAASPKRRPRGTGPLATYADLVAWGKRHGVLDAAGAKRLARAAADRPVDSALAVHRAGVLRELVERILLALAERKAPDPSDIEALNAEIARAERRLVSADTGCRWVWVPRGDNDLERMLWPVVLSAADVLTSEDHRRVRRCGGQGCDLLFVDRSPGSHRKWCTREDCGHRARSHRRYHVTIKPRREERRRQRRQIPEAPASERG